MGADLYIKSISDKVRAKYKPRFDKAVEMRDQAIKNGDEVVEASSQALVEFYFNKMNGHGYFRDSYNSSSLLWVLGLSWWGDINKMLDKKGNLSVANTKKLLEMIKERKVPNPLVLNEKMVTIDDGENSLAEWRKYFVKKRVKFIKFLETAISLREPIYCST
jgi:hypothetical protein